MSKINEDEVKKFQDLKIANIKKYFDKYDLDIEYIWLCANSRRKINMAVNANNQLGTFQERTKKIIPTLNVIFANDAINDLLVILQKFLNKFPRGKISQVNITSFDNVLDVIFTVKDALNHDDELMLIEFGKANSINISLKIKNEIYLLFSYKNNYILVNDQKIEMPSDAFIQPSVEGLKIIIDFLQQNISKYSYEPTNLDLYAGCGLYSFALAKQIKQSSCFEGSENMIKSIKNNAKNLGLSSKILAFERDLYNDPLSCKELNKFDNIVINPPRNGAEPQIMNIAKADVKAVQYISCNPQTLARDTKILIDSKYKLTNIISLDQFYLTSHQEVLTNFIKI